MGGVKQRSVINSPPRYLCGGGEIINGKVGGGVGESSLERGGGGKSVPREASNGGN